MHFYTNDILQVKVIGQGQISDLSDLRNRAINVSLKMSCQSIKYFLRFRAYKFLPKKIRTISMLTLVQLPSQVTLQWSPRGGH